MSRVKLYRGIDQFGNVRSGKVEVPEGMSAYELLISQGIKPLKIEDVSESIWSRELFKENPPKRMLPFANTDFYATFFWAKLTKSLRDCHPAGGR